MRRTARVMIVVIMMMMVMMLMMVMMMMMMMMMCGFPKMMGTFWGIPRMRIMVFGVHIGVRPPILGITIYTENDACSLSALLLSMSATQTLQ